MKKMTHIGNRVGIAYNKGMFEQIKLRETAKFWVSEYKTKYCKLSGYPIGEKFATFKLDIESIKELK